MKPTIKTACRAKPRRLGDWVTELQSRGQYTFGKDEALDALSVSNTALKQSAARLVAKGRLAVLKRGFYVIVPAEYRAAGAPPPPWYVDDLMGHMGRPYYVGLLSAASLYGAGHQQPLSFQVVTDLPRRPLRVGRAEIRFYVKGDLQKTAIRKMKTETGFMRVSTPESTAFDLVRYPSASGGLSNIATVLSELSEEIARDELLKTAESGGQAALVQRLGYLLQVAGAEALAKTLARWVERRNPRVVLLRPGFATRGARVDRRFRVAVNEEVEVDR